MKGGLNKDETALVDTVCNLMLIQDYTSYDEILTEFRELVNGEPNAECLLAAVQRVTDKLSGFSWDKAVIDGEISQVIAETPEDADKLLLEFFNYKAAQSEERTTLLLIDEVHELSWDGKSPLVSRILRQGRKFGIAGVFSTQYLNADCGKNITSALKQIGTHFVFRPSDDIAALNQLGFKSGNDKAREILQFLDTGEALAKGNISTDICPLDYPVKITVDP